MNTIESHTHTLLKQNFALRPFAGKLEIKTLGRPTSTLKITEIVKRRKDGYVFTRYFHNDVYDKYLWLCSCEFRNVLFCFSCLVLEAMTHGPRIGVKDLRDVNEYVKNIWYTSKHHHMVIDEAKRKLGKCTTMGHAEVPLNGPQDFLKKKSRVAPQKVIPDKPKREKLRPPLPPRPKPDETLKPTDKHDVKNFKKRNVIRVKQAVPPPPRRKRADTVHGDTHEADISGFVLQYCLSKKYGKVPKYLQRLKNKTDESCAAEKKTEKEEETDVREVTEEERKEILHGLKENWEELQRRFQALPMLTDTLPKINHKLLLEKRLKQLEHDIRTLERHPHIYIVDNNGFTQ